MNILIKFFFSSLILIPVLHAKDCPDTVGRYGNGIQYQDIACRFYITADRTDSISNRNVTFTDEGLIQVFSNFPGTTNSNSTGARVYYLFPIRGEKRITEANENNLGVVHPSGVKFNFNNRGVISSPDVRMRVSTEINSQNKSGVEIEGYSKGIVIDFGYRMGNSPVLNPNAPVTITDKHSKSCRLINSDLHKIQRYDAEFIYKTNTALHGFLSRKCPTLDLSDLVNPKAESFKALTRPDNLGAAPRLNTDTTVNDSAPGPKSFSDVEAFIDSLGKKGRQATSK